jgi:hypothetical protein
MLWLQVFEVEKIGERKITPEGNLQMMLAGMGTRHCTWSLTHPVTPCLCTTSCAS